jgi:tryptophan 2,3-dioxygenase
LSRSSSDAAATGRRASDVAAAPPSPPPGGLTYGSYLKVPELLGLQQEVSSPPHHDELFFIIIHQTYELWFKECLHESDLLIEHLREGSISRSLKVLKRVNAIVDLLVDQIRLLATLTPVEFAGFRDRLRPASGFQSTQFRELEFLYGHRDPVYLQYFATDSAGVAALRRRDAAPSLWDEFIRCFHRAGYAVDAALLDRDVTTPYVLNENLTAEIKRVYEQPHENYHWVLMFEALLDLDALFRLWRSTHVAMVARTIGHKRGTGGSSGVDFLRSRENITFFPELWEVRSLIGGAY